MGQAPALLGLGCAGEEAPVRGSFTPLCSDAYLRVSGSLLPSPESGTPLRGTQAGVSAAEAWLGAAGRALVLWGLEMEQCLLSPCLWLCCVFRWSGAEVSLLLLYSSFSLLSFLPLTFSLLFLLPFALGLIT